MGGFGLTRPKDSPDKELYYYIAVDFDGTLHSGYYGNLGSPRQDVFDLVESYKSYAVSVGLEPIVILWTCRCGESLSEAVKWCYDNNFHLDYVNENPLFWMGDWQRKIFAHVYIDDKGVAV